jgi:hypothetical protein
VKDLEYTGQVVGDYLPVNGIWSKVVAFRKTLKGPLLTEPDKYLVFVEQSGDFRLGTVRIKSEVTG